MNAPDENSTLDESEDTTDVFHEVIRSLLIPDQTNLSEELEVERSVFVDADKEQGPSSRRASDGLLPLPSPVLSPLGDTTGQGNLGATIGTGPVFSPNHPSQHAQNLTQPLLHSVPHSSATQHGSQPIRGQTNSDLSRRSMDYPNDFEPIDVASASEWSFSQAEADLLVATLRSEHQRYYESLPQDMDKSWRTLMCVVLGHPALYGSDFQQQPYASLPHHVKKRIAPQRKDLVREEKRRRNLLVAGTENRPPPSQQNMSTLLAWLRESPIEETPAGLHYFQEKIYDLQRLLDIRPLEAQRAARMPRLPPGGLPNAIIFRARQRKALESLGRNLLQYATDVVARIRSKYNRGRLVLDLIGATLRGTSVTMSNDELEGLSTEVMRMKLVHQNDQDHLRDRSVLPSVMSIDETIQSIFGSMKEGRQDAVLQECGCAAIADLGSDNEHLIQLILARGGLSRILQAMEAHYDSPKVQLRALAALWTLWKSDTPFCRDLRKTVHLVVFAMKQHYDDIDVQVTGCLLLECLVRIHHTLKLLAHTGGTSTVITAMWKHSSNTKVQMAGMLLLKRLSSIDSSAFFEGRRLDVVIQTMECHIASAGIQECGATIFVNVLSTYGDHTDWWSRTFDVVLDALAKHESDVEVQKIGIKYLGLRLLSDHQGGTKVSRTCVDVMARVMKAHIRDASVQITGLIGWENLLRQDLKYKSLLARQECIQRITLAMKRFPDDTSIKKVGSATLFTIIEGGVPG